MGAYLEGSAKGPRYVVSANSNRPVPSDPTFRQLTYGRSRWVPTSWYWQCMPEAQALFRALDVVKTGRILPGFNLSRNFT